MGRNNFLCNELRQTDQPWIKSARPRVRGTWNKCKPLVHRDLRQAVLAGFRPQWNNGVEQWGETMGWSNGRQNTPGGRFSGKPNKVNYPFAGLQ